MKRPKESTWCWEARWELLHFPSLILAPLPPAKLGSDELEILNPSGPQSGAAAGPGLAAQEWPQGLDFARAEGAGM